MFFRVPGGVRSARPPANGIHPSGIKKAQDKILRVVLVAGALFFERSTGLITLVVAVTINPNRRNRFGKLHRIAFAGRTVWVAQLNQYAAAFGKDVNHRT